jgi:hypothetical protein
MPLPDSAAVGEVEPVTWRMASRLPAVVAMKSTRTLQVSAGASVSAQLFAARTKSAAAGPPTAIEVRVAGPSPRFVIENVWRAGGTSEPTL